MTKRFNQLAGAAALSLAVAAPAFADIKLNDNFSVGGYAVGSANYVEIKPSEGDKVSTSKLDGDAYKFWSNITFAPVTGTISFYAGQSGQPVILDAYATYDAGGGTKITFGKFLSWLGYEAFDPINMTQITYGWDTAGTSGMGFALANIPAYHTGVKVDVGNDTYGAGVAVLDSVDPVFVNGIPSKGDGDLKNGPGFEAYFTYKGVKDLTLWAGATYEHNTGVQGLDFETTPYGVDIDKMALDLWAQYVVGDTTYAAEYSVRKDDSKVAFIPDQISTFWLAEVQQTIDKQWAITARVSWVGIDYKDTEAPDPSAVKFTIAPTLTLTPNLSIVGEYSYIKYHKADWKDGNFVAAQVRFKF